MSTNVIDEKEKELIGYVKDIYDEFVLDYKNEKYGIFETDVDMDKLIDSSKDYSYNDYQIIGFCWRKVQDHLEKGAGDDTFPEHEKYKKLYDGLGKVIDNAQKYSVPFNIFTNMFDLSPIESVMEITYKDDPLYQIAHAAKYNYKSIHIEKTLNKEDGQYDFKIFAYDEKGTKLDLITVARQSNGEVIAKAEPGTPSNFFADVNTKVSVTREYCMNLFYRDKELEHFKGVKDVIIHSNRAEFSKVEEYVRKVFAPQQDDEVIITEKQPQVNEEENREEIIITEAQPQVNEEDDFQAKLKEDPTLFSTVETEQFLDKDFIKTCLTTIKEELKRRVNEVPGDYVTKEFFDKTMEIVNSVKNSLADGIEKVKNMLNEAIDSIGEDPNQDPNQGK